MQMLEQVVQTAKQALYRPAKTHLIVPAVADSLNGDGIDVVRHEGAVRAGSVAEPLADHAPEHGLEALLVGVAVLPHALEGAGDAHLTIGDIDGRVEEVEVG